MKAKQKQSKAVSQPSGQRYCPKCRSEYQGWVKNCIDCGTELTNELPRIPPTQSKKVTPENIVTIATFYNPEEAHLSKAELEAYGIPSFVADDNFVSLNRFYAIAAGGVRLLVKESDAEKAIQILKPDQEKAQDSVKSEEEHCPKCHSEDVQYNVLSIRRIFLTILLLGFPIPFFKRKWKCKNCGHEWKSEEENDLSSATPSSTD